MSPQKQKAFLLDSFVCLPQNVTNSHIFTRFLFQISNRCGTMQRVSVRVARVSLHSYFPPPQLAARRECEIKWCHAAMQLNDWSPACTLHSRVTSCINNGLSSIQIVRVCNVQSPFCKMSLRYCWVLDVTNHLAIKLDNFHTSWHFLDTSIHEYNYQSST